MGQGAGTDAHGSSCTSNNTSSNITVNSGTIMSTTATAGQGTGVNNNTSNNSSNGNNNTVNNTTAASSKVMVGLTLQDQSNVHKLRFEDYYTVGTKISSGSFGVVYTCKPTKYKQPTTSHAPTTQPAAEQEEQYAVKVIDRSRLKKVDADAVFREVGLLREVQHLPHVVTIMDFFVPASVTSYEKGNMYVVQTLAAGGDVFSRLSQRTSYTEKDARELSRILLSVIDKLHDLQPCPIVHRDLKPENLLLANPQDNTSILLCDFGFARHINPNSKNSNEQYCKTRCGTPAFVAPEIVLGLPYGVSVDLWSTGCLLYMLMGGYPPFQADNHRALFRKIRAGDFVFHNKYFATVSIPAKRLISNLLTVNVNKRWTAKQALKSDWFENTTSKDLSSHDLTTSLVHLKQIKAKMRWKSAAGAVRWAISAPFWTSDKVSFQQQLLTWDKEVINMNNNGAASSIAAPRSPTSAGNNGTTIADNTVSAPACAIVALNGNSTHGTTSPATTPPPSVGLNLLAKLPRIRFQDVYELKQQIRKGSCATIWEAKHLVTHETYAVKVIQRNKLQPNDDQVVLNEVAILQSLNDNKYVVHLMDFYEEEDAFYLVMEYCNGGDVFDRLVTLTLYTEKDARDLAERLLKALASLHKMGIAHRDLKPQNLLLSKGDNPTHIKVADFGFARRVHTPQSLTTRVGTPTYVAPEILKNIPHDERVDLWSIGVIIYTLLVGYPPFMEDDQLVLFQKIRKGEYKFYEEDWRHISQDAKDLIRGLLVPDPKERWTIEEALQCRWISKDARHLSSVNLTESLMILKSKRNRLRTLARAFMWSGAKELKGVDVVTQAQETVTSIVQSVTRVHNSSER